MQKYENSFIILPIKKKKSLLSFGIYGAYFFAFFLQQEQKKLLFLRH